MLPDILKKKIAAVTGQPFGFLLYVNTARQWLELLEGDSTVAGYPVSTAKNGIGNREGSFQTPPGIHRIVEKYGDTAPSGRIFRDRLDTGACWSSSDGEGDFVLTRIIRLEGLEPGVNRGPGIDSYERYIYIHGTSKESSIGTPLSHGCIVMRNDDVIKLYDVVKEGDIVVID